MSIQQIKSGVIADGAATQTKIGSGVAGTGPAFSARMGSSQGVTTATLTKLTFNTEIFDTASCYDPTTNYRFTPNVEGYYQVNAIVTANAGSGTLLFLYIYKNGSQYVLCDTRPSFAVLSAQVSDIIYMNGSTDYLELYGRIDGISPQFFGTTLYSRFSGALVRAA